MTEHRTVGDDISAAQSTLEHAVDTDGYEQLEAADRAHLREALHFLALVQD